jgi:hypothetical protein
MKVSKWLFSKGGIVSPEDYSIIEANNPVGVTTTKTSFFSWSFA